MRKLKIKEPIWNGRRIGIASYIQDDIEIEILAKNKEGIKHFPNKFILYRKDMLKYPVYDHFRRGVPVRVVPIADLAVV